jgi:hypothetical protein
MISSHSCKALSPVFIDTQTSSRLGRCGNDGETQSGLILIIAVLDHLNVACKADIHLIFRKASQTAGWACEKDPVYPARFAAQTRSTCYFDRRHSPYRGCAATTNRFLFLPASVK